MLMLVRPATGSDAAKCLDIYRPYVLDTPLTFEVEVPTVQEMAARILAAQERHEWLILEVDGSVAGYGYAQQLDSRAAYRWSVELSVYLEQDEVSSGGGRTLYDELLSRLARRGFRRAFGCIVQPNDASNALHEALEFEPVGHFRRVGWKLGAWHDVQWWQLDLGAADDEVDPPQEITT
jgi:L-amino acid N-acyltransferase YncA